MIKKRLTVFTCILMCVIFVLPAQAATIGEKQISSQGACVMDFETGQILYEHNGNVPRVPASMTKLMTVYCVYDAIRSGMISMNTPVPISSYVYNLSRNPSYQGIPLHYNTTYTVDEMLAIVITYSACAPAAALAELISGSEARFVSHMNDMARKMGIDATYYDCFGVMNNQVSPVAMVTLARNLIKEFPDIIVRTSKRSINFHGSTFYSTNKLFSTYYYEGADGLKTGTTSASGYCFCGTAVRNGRRIIAVTMASSSSNQRFADMINLLDYGFAAMPGGMAAIYNTDIRTFINGVEIPTYAYTDHEVSKPVIIAEQLVNYGFTASYNADTCVLMLTLNPDAAFAPLTVYGAQTGEKVFDIVPNNNITVIINDGSNDRFIYNVYNLNGYMAMDADELGAIFGFSWDEASRSIHVDTSTVKREMGPATDKNTVFFTDMSTVFNGHEIPTFLYKGGEYPYTVVIAEDLHNYGFNVNYNEETQVLTLTYMPEKQSNPIPIEYYKDKNGLPAFGIYNDSTSVEVCVGDKKYVMENVHATDGYMFVSVDEFAKFASFSWNDATRCATVGIN